MLTTRTTRLLQKTLLHTPKKHCNHKPRAFKTLRLAIMKRSRLKNNAKKAQLPSNEQNYKKQRNLVTKLNKLF